MDTQVLINYKYLIDLDNNNHVLSYDIINQLYEMNNNCFSELPEKSPEKYYRRLIKYLHNNTLKQYRGNKSKNSSSSSTSSISSNSINNGGYYQGLYNTDYIFKGNYSDNIRYELNILYTDHTQTKVAFSCFNSYNQNTKLARIFEICINPSERGKRLCKPTINIILNNIKNNIIDNNLNINRIMMYCVNSNIYACKCYSSVFDINDKNVSHNKRITNTGESRTEFYYHINNKRKRSTT